MSTKDLQRKPTTLSPRLWYYEEGHGITLIVTHGQNDVEHLRISWQKIRNMLRRKDKH